jgi:cystinosin
VAWSISFYPQIYQNWLRKSVVGLSFDYLLYNLLGFLCYSVYQTTLYFNDFVRNQYKEEHGEVPVQLNDVVFALHGLAMVLVMIFQSIIYERGEQRLSLLSYFITGFFLFGLGVLGLLVVSPWVRLVYWIEGTGYVKAALTVIKYSPQVYINWKYKSTGICVCGYSFANSSERGLEYLGSYA